MRIAIGKKNEQGRLRFEVDIPGLCPFPVELDRSDQRGERAPGWIAYYRGERCGAFWRKIPRQGGDAFLSGHLESPAFPGGRMEVAIFASKETGGQKDMVWSPQRRDERPAQDASASRPEANHPPAATDAGDDDIPF